MSRSICVFSSSSDELDDVYFDHAQRLGELIGSGGDTLVYGGGKIGLMGRMAVAVQRTGGRVVGVIPESMKTVELAYYEADELVVTETMRQRKHVMDQRADAFVAMAGGFGTLEELAEVIALKLLKFHDKPIVIMNTNGFYDKMLELFEQFVQKRFAKQKYLALYDVVGGPDDVMMVLQEKLNDRPRVVD